jgi:hypothetical protein
VQLKFSFAAPCLAAALILVGCGGSGSGSGPAPSTIPGAGTSSATQSSIHVATQPTTATLPATGGYTGTLAFPAAKTATDLRASATTIAPAATARRLASTGDSFFYAITLTSPVTLVLSGIPAIVLNFPADPPASGPIFLSVSNAATGEMIATDGPAGVSGRTVTFPIVSMPLTLEAGVAYVFAVYSTAHRSLLYAANYDDDSITVYDANSSGNVQPLRRIAGPATQLHGPISLAVDDGGVLWALSGKLDPLTATAYADDASGNTAPLKAYTLTNVHTNGGEGIGPGAALTLTPDGTGFVVAGLSLTPGIGRQNTIGTYATSSGALQRSFVPGATLNYCFFCFPIVPTAKGLFRGIGFDHAGNIITGHYLRDRRALFNSVLVFDPASVTTDPTIATQPLSRADLNAIGEEFAGFASGAGEYGWARGSNAAPVPSEVDVFNDTAGGTLTQQITGSRTLLDAKVDAIGIASDHSVYVASRSGFVNVYRANQTGNAAPIGQISGALTGLVGTSALALGRQDRSGQGHR